jgi:hypothetical protein
VTTGGQVFQTQAAVRTRSQRAHWHWPAPHRQFAPPPGAACGGQRLARETGRDPREVLPPDRCQGRGCAERWSTVTADPDLLSLTEDPTQEPTT